MIKAVDLLLCRCEYKYKDFKSLKMSLSEIHIKDVRNITSTQLQPSSKLNVIVGPNGSGKTSLLEGLYLLSRARSFRTHNIKKVISYEQKNLLVYAELNHRGVKNKIALKKDATETVIRINGKTEKKSSELSRYLLTHLIRPESQALLEGGAAIRRSFVDWGVFHVKHDFINTSKRYNQLLKQRNKLLKSKQFETLHSWNDKLAECGIMVASERERYIIRLEVELRLISKELLGEADISIEYLKGWDKELTLSQALDKTRARDIQYGYTTMGAHKSDIRILVNNKLAQDFLSRGQMKLLVIALYLAQIKVMFERQAKSACVLLDDLAAELDANNFRKVMSFLVNLDIQVFVTTTNESLFLEYIESKGSKVFHVKHGCIQKGVV
ncbi:MAG: DNA replication/repair protein RecF [Cycloclasticus sp.]